MAVVPRGKGTWRVRVYDPQTRKQIGPTVHGTKKQAELVEAEIKARVEAGTHVEPSKLSFSQYLDRWIADYVKGSLRPRAVRFYSTIVDRHLKPQLGHIPLVKLGAADLQHYYAQTLAGGRLDHKHRPTGKPLSPATVHGHHRTIHRALEQAVRWGLVARNVADAADPPRVTRYKARTLNLQETLKLLGAAKNTRLYALILAATTTGLRQGELLGLRWQDVNLDTGTLTIRQILRKSGKHPEFGPPKTREGFRSVQMLDELAAGLKTHKARQNEERLQFGNAWEDYGLVFTVPGGRPMDPNVLSNYHLPKLLEKAELPHIRFHDLRHTHATLLLEQGVHLKVVSERLGHSTISITGDIYSHVLPTMQQQAAHVLNQALFGDGEKPQAVQQANSADVTKVVTKLPQKKQ